MKLFLTFHEGAVLLEDAPTESSVEVILPEQDMAVLAAIMKLDSFELARAMGSLAMFAIKLGHRDSRRTVTAA